MPTEPSSIAIAVSALINAVLAALVTFNVGLTQEQTGAIALVANAAFGLGWSVYVAVKKPKPPAA